VAQLLDVETFYPQGSYYRYWKSMASPGI